MTHEYTDAGFLIADIPFGGIFLLHGEGVPRRCEQLGCIRGRAAGFHHRFGNILWLSEGAGHKHTWSAGLEGIEERGVAESIGIEFNTELLA